MRPIRSGRQVTSWQDQGPAPGPDAEHRRERRCGPLVPPASGRLALTAAAGLPEYGLVTTTELLGTRLDGRTTRAATRDPARSRPRVNLTVVLAVGELVAGAIVIADRLAGRPPAPKAVVRMGPGGWVSMRGGKAMIRPARSADHRISLPDLSRRRGRRLRPGWIRR